jgi:hypothetical protein
MSSEKHIADAESTFVVVSVTPDFCKVGKAIIPFDISQTLSPEKARYASSVSARSKAVLLLDSVIQGVQGNAGKGLASGVSLGGGHSKITQGSATVLIESRQTARHLDEVQMNGGF